MHTPATTTFARCRSALRREAGITLIEALIALLVLSLGMLALAQVQSMLRYNSDVAKQRSEAVRIAQANMESLRAFGRLTATTGFKSYAEVAASGPTQVTGITTNTTFSVTNAVTEVTSPQYKALTVSVTWTDRNGTAQSVSVNSLISRTDPSLASQLAIPPEGSPVRNPFDRNVRIPIQATDLGNDKSGFTPPGSEGFYFVFDNTNADIIEKCTGTLSQEAYEDIQDGTDTTNTCDASRRGYLISGFVNFDLRNQVSATSPGSTVCDFYADSAMQSLITAASPGSPTLSTFFNQVISPSNASTSAADMFAFTVSIDVVPSRIYDGAAGVLPAANLVIEFSSSTVTGNSKAFQYFGTSPITLRNAGTGQSVETFTPVLSGEAVSATGSQGGSAVLSVSGGKGLLTINPAADLTADTAYEIVLPASTIRFVATTGPQPRPTDPVLTSTVRFTSGPGPAFSVTAPTTIDGNIVGTFSEPVTAQSTGIVYLYRAGNGNNATLVETFNLANSGAGSGGGSMTLDAGGTTLTINPGADLVPGAEYFIDIEPNIFRDAAGNPFAGTSSPQPFTVGSVSVNASCPNNVADVRDFMNATLTLSSTGHPTPPFECYADDRESVAIPTTRTVGYFCAVYLSTSNTSGWSGVLNLLAPASWTSSYKACRYYDPDGDNVVPNDEHPAAYTNVNSSLTDQNFLIVRSSRSCPSEVVDIGSQTGISVHYKTLDHQP
jgi:type IV pilus modification protein PilV